MSILSMAKLVDNVDSNQINIFSIIFIFMNMYVIDIFVQN